MNFRTDTPIPGIHEDLFNLFILKCIGVETWSFESRDQLDWWANIHKNLEKDLFPLENHPEQYKFHVIQQIDKESYDRCDYWHLTLSKDSAHGFDKKITITVENENEQVQRRD